MGRDRAREVRLASSTFAEEHQPTLRIGGPASRLAGGTFEARRAALHRLPAGAERLERERRQSLARHATDVHVAWQLPARDEEDLRERGVRQSRAESRIDLFR